MKSLRYISKKTEKEYFKHKAYIKYKNIFWSNNNVIYFVIHKLRKVKSIAFLEIWWCRHWINSFSSKWQEHFRSKNHYRRQTRGNIHPKHLLENFLITCICVWSLKKHCQGLHDQQSQVFLVFKWTIISWVP